MLLPYKSQKQLRRISHSSVNQPSAKIRRSTAVFGKGSQSSTSIAIEGIRRADLFVSRLRPETTSESIIDLVQNLFPSHHSVKAEKLVTKFDSYASYRVELTVKQSKFDDLVHAIYKEESWPSGVLVRRFYRPINGAKRD